LKIHKSFHEEASTFPIANKPQKLSCSLLVSQLIFKSPRTNHPPKYTKKETITLEISRKLIKVIQVKEALASLPRKKQKQQQEELIFRSCAFRIISSGRISLSTFLKRIFFLFAAQAGRTREVETKYRFESLQR
jgi:hypothetical protein